MSVISLYDVLKANKGLPVGEPIACHWGRKLGGGAAGYDELTGTPPLTFTANGRNLINYRIYGANDGVGERSIPYGYQINAVVSSENLWDYNLHESAGLWDNNGQFVENSAYIILREPIEIDPNYSYTYGMESGYSRGTYFSYAWFDANGDIISSKRKTIAVEVGNRYTETFTPPANARYINIATYMHNSKRMFVKGSAEPASYVPYSVTSTPVYIGDTPLAQGEYVDYGEQKVYKYVGGVLTPTDPPVALPALPTIDGATIVDFDNTPKPSEVYIKYPK